MNAWLLANWPTVLGLMPWAVAAIFLWAIVRIARDLR